MLPNRRRETAPLKDRAHRALRTAPFWLLLVVALTGAAHSLWHGHWLVLGLNAVTLAIAVWGLRLPHPRTTTAEQVPATEIPADPPGGGHPAPSTQATRPLAHPQHVPPEAPAHSVTAEAPEELPVVGSFAITGHIHHRATGTTGRLTLILPTDTEVTTTPVVAALLTTGHRILTDHHLTHHRLPEVDLTTVDRAEELPTTTPPAGFTVHVTNDLTTRHSGITIDADQLLATQEGTLLIAAALLAGADRLLDNPNRPLHHRTPPAPRRRGHRGRHSHSPAPRSTHLPERP